MTDQNYGGSIKRRLNFGVFLKISNHYLTLQRDYVQLMNIQVPNAFVPSDSMNFTASDVSQAHFYVIYQAELCSMQIEISGKMVTPNGEA